MSHQDDGVAFFRLTESVYRLKGCSMEFFDNLTDALRANNGQLNLEQVTDLLPNHQKHRVMTHLNAARNSGICAYAAKVEGGKGKVIVTLPKPAVTTRQTLVGGSS